MRVLGNIRGQFVEMGKKEPCFMRCDRKRAIKCQYKCYAEDVSTNAKRKPVSVHLLAN